MVIEGFTGHSREVYILRLFIYVLKHIKGSRKHAVLYKNDVILAVGMAVLATCTVTSTSGMVM